MTEIERIQDQLKRAFEEGAWHGPSVLEILQDVTASQAAERPIKDAHNIWELTLHIAAWNNAGRRRLSGDRAELPDEEDWHGVSDTSDQSWASTKALLTQSYRDLITAIAALNSDRLDEPILARMSSVYVTLHGVVQHGLYHAGQIAILKKATAGSEDHE